MATTGRATGVYPLSEEDSEAREKAVGASALRKVSLRLLPLIGLGYGLALMDRTNIGFAALQMNADLHFSASVYGMGAGLFFVGYALCEVPSNLLLVRFGARRWLARIMFTWGLLAAATMFVRTPLQFNVLRVLLGVAEAGFFPGAIYCLTLWFPARERARAVSRFYIGWPLSSVAMGALAGWLLGLGGKMGLAGWQWMFLLEGLPAVLLSLAVLKVLPDGPAKAAWLTQEEKAWLQGQLKADSAAAHLGDEAGVAKALLSPKVWTIGAFFFCIMTATYAYGFYAPAILQGATGWSATKVGFLIAAFGMAGAAGMLLNAMHSDRTGERELHCIVPCLTMAGGFLMASYAHSAWIVVAAFAVCSVSTTAMQGPALAVPTQFLSGRAAAAGIAAMNTIALFGGLAGPLWMGLMKDATGSYQAGLRGLPIPSLGAAGIMFLLARSLKRRASIPLRMATELSS
jgi:ACS family tartrate transporter-like MFS transporter